MNAADKKQSEPMSAEKFRSKFRHDLRSNFSVLIGFGEVLRDDLTESQQPAMVILGALIDEARLSLDATIALINQCSIQSIAVFKNEVKAGLRGQTLAGLRSLNDKLRELESVLGKHELMVNLFDALRELILRCKSPFDEKITLPSRKPKDNSGSSTTDTQEDPRSRVMVIDDEPHNLHLIGTFLGRLNLAVSTFTDGTEALAALEQSHFDLILLDLHMPAMSGLEFLKIIKSKPEHRDIPVLVVTASDDVDELAECIEAGAVDSLPKPFQSAFLRARVLTSLNLQEAKKRERAFAEELQNQKNRVEDLLEVILPRDVIDELQSTGEVQPRRHDHVCVLFCDIVNFTQSCDTEDPVKILAHLQSLFSQFEAISDLYGLQKIKTIGDSFMAAIGLNPNIDNPELAAARAGLEMIACTNSHPSGWKVRVGIHAGPVVSGLVGSKQFLFDIWGDTVNIAARVERNGSPQTLTVSKTVFERLSGSIRGHSLGLINLKGKGQHELFAVDEIC